MRYAEVCKSTVKKICTVSENKKHLTNKRKSEINCGHTVDIMEDKLLLGPT